MIKNISLSSFFLIMFLGLIGPNKSQASESFRISQLQIISETQIHLFTVEIAETSYQRSLGLQNRKTMLPNHGMLFDFKKTVAVTMWMKNTPLSLDMFFINENGTIINIARNTEPFSLKHIKSAGPAKAVLEVLAGTAKRLNIKAGDQIVHSMFQN